MTLPGFEPRPGTPSRSSRRCQFPLRTSARGVTEGLECPLKTAPSDDSVANSVANSAGSAGTPPGKLATPKTIGDGPREVA